MSSSLQELQRRMASAVMQPLTRNEAMRQRSSSGRSNYQEADEFIRPNARMNSFERLEIYNRQYWFRLFSSFEEDFPGLQAIVGKKRFQSLMRAYLVDCPSTSFSLRNLGSKLFDWLQQNPAYTGPDHNKAIEMVALEWAHIEAFDSAVWPKLNADALATIGGESRMTIQPHVRLVHAHYAIDDALLTVRNESGSSNASSNNATISYKNKRLKLLRNLSTENVYLAVHRYDDSIYYKRLSIEDFSMLSALQLGKTLSASIDLAFENSTMPDQDRPAHVQSAFRHWMEIGWFCVSPALTESERSL